MSPGGLRDISRDDRKGGRRIEEPECREAFIYLGTEARYDKR